jgi:hypothetical protein
MGIHWKLICLPKYTHESFREYESLRLAPVLVVAFLLEKYVLVLQSRSSRIQERQLGSIIFEQQTQERNQHEMHGGLGYFKSQPGTHPTAECTVYRASVNIKQPVRRKNILGPMVHSYPKQ